MYSGRGTSRDEDNDDRDRRRAPIVSAPSSPQTPSLTSSSSIASENVPDASEDPRILMPEDTNPRQQAPGASGFGADRGGVSQTRNPDNRHSVHFVESDPTHEVPTTSSSFVGRDLSQASRLPSVLRPAATPDVGPSASGPRQRPLTPSNLPELTFDATRNHPKAPTAQDLFNSFPSQHPISTSIEHSSSVPIISSPVSTPIPPALIFAQQERSYFTSDTSPSPISDLGNTDPQANQARDTNRQPRPISQGDLPFTRRSGGGDPGDSRSGEGSSSSGTAYQQSAPHYSSHPTSQPYYSFQSSSLYPDQSAYQGSPSGSRPSPRHGTHPGAHPSAPPSAPPGAQHGVQSGAYHGVHIAQPSAPPPRPAARPAYPPPRHIPTIQQPPLPVLPGTDSFRTATPDEWEQAPPPRPPGSERDRALQFQPQPPLHRPPRDANAPARRGDDNFQVRRELPNPQPRGRTLPPGTHGP